MGNGNELGTIDNRATNTLLSMSVLTTQAVVCELVLAIYLNNACFVNNIVLQVCETNM